MPGMSVLKNEALAAPSIQNNLPLNTSWCPWVSQRGANGPAHLSKKKTTLQVKNYFNRYTSIPCYQVASSPSILLETTAYYANGDFHKFQQRWNLFPKILGITKRLDCTYLWVDALVSRRFKQRSNTIIRIWYGNYSIQKLLSMFNSKPLHLISYCN